ncbi:MAG: TetR/AcrR family transcriptional regulator [Marinoscillum sp.]
MRIKDEHKLHRIHDQAIEIIVKDGFDGLSMHKLANAASVSPGTIYIYFKDREDLIRQIAIIEESRLFENTLEGFDPNMTFGEGLKIQWHNRAKYFLENPQKMHFMEQIKYSRFHEDVSSELRPVFIGQMTSFVKNAIKSKQLKPLPIEVYWSLAFAPLYQLVKFHIHNNGLKGQTFQLTEEALEIALSSVLKGLKP